MKILITGCNGQLGKALIRTKPKQFDLIKADKSMIDFEKPEECSKVIDKIRPEFVINTAAYTNVDKAESEKNKAFQINTKAPEIISKSLKLYGGKLIQISTDYVFDGQKKLSYSPNDKKNPQNFYGHSKDQAEERLLKILKKKNHLIILRTSWLIGPIGKNFLLTILSLLNKKKNLNIVNDQYGSMTSTYSLSDIIWRLIDKNNMYSSKGLIFPKLHHWCDEGKLNWYELALAIREYGLELNLLNNPAQLIPISSKEYNFEAKRPLYSVLDCSATEKLLGIKKTYWRKSLFNIMKMISDKSIIASD